MFATLNVAGLMERQARADKKHFVRTSMNWDAASLALNRGPFRDAAAPFTKIYISYSECCETQ
jgi:hypothetical protein